ncbi:MAG TPA: DUF4097 family beta strand repeat-containing protein [Thermoanaerobaculia bacterium]|jgi:DUF4097 and DUF4098 domain-containing protein YvlB|nr:DUF4097 family beta strand repeat-containing protein [Thermoanaerobaculia bacterium]
MTSTRTLAVASALALTGAAGAWAGSASERVERTLTLPASRQVVVENFNGSVAVTGWDQAQVRLVAVKTARAATDGRARAYLHDLGVQIDQRGDKLVIRTKSPGAEGGIKGWLACAGVDGEVSYQLSLPRETELSVSTVNGNVEIVGLVAPVRAASTNGNVVVLEVGGEVDASSVNGSIRVGMRRAEPRSAMELSTVNGSILVILPDDFRAYVDARTTNGSVGSDLPLLVEGHRSRSRLVGRLNGGITRLTLRTTNGSIWLKKP